MERKKCSHPTGFDSVRITPELQDNPDLERLGRALIAAAINIAEKKREEEETVKRSLKNRERNDMT